MNFSTRPATPLYSMPTVPLPDIHSVVESPTVKKSPTVQFDSLTSSYWQAQVARIQDTLDKIVKRGPAVSPGRVLPNDESLALGEGRHLSMAVLFLDISSFSSRPSGTKGEQEILLRVMTLFFSEMIRIAEDYGGTVEKNTGDGLMAYFESTSEHTEESGSKRALAAALSMFYINAQILNPILVQSGIAPIQFRIGIDYGPVTIARVGVPKRFNSVVAIGSTANIACKMLSKADPDEIVIGESVVQQLPTGWVAFCHLKVKESGWVYVQNQTPYPFYRYTGRWTGPL